jgi:hypothetical protein
MDFDLKAHPINRIIYLPKKLYDILGKDIKAVPDGKTVLCYSKDTPIEEVLTSIEVIKVNLCHDAHIGQKVK